MTFQPDKALKHRLLMFGGEEEAERRKAVDSVIAAAGLEKDDFDLQLFMADESGPKDWFAAAGTSPFLAPKRTVVVRHLLRANPEEVAGTDFSKLPESSLLILVADDEIGDENKQMRLKTLSKQWKAKVEAAKGACFMFESNPQAVRDAIKQEVVRQGKTISEQAAAGLVEMTGGSMSRALDELVKLELFLGGQTNIRESDVREIVMPSREWNVYRMVDCAFNGQIPEALRQLRVLTGASPKAEDAAFQRILPAVSKHLRLLWQARACIDANCSSPSFAPEAVARMFPDKHNLAKENPYRVTTMMTLAKRLSLVQIQRCFAILSDTDIRLKGGLGGFTAVDTLERMLLEMAAAVATSR